MGARNLEALKTELLRGMREYMADGGVDYAESEINRCGEIIDRCICASASATGRDQYLSAVEQAVCELNVLGAEFAELIETEQREQICQILILGGSERGFWASDEDVTEQWREW